MGDAVRLMMGDCVEKMGEIADASVDAIICDPIYPEISRSYGRIGEADWHVLMKGVVAHSRRILKPTGSAVFILQPNSERIGKMRPWLFQFQAWACEYWNMVQDAYWWNYTAIPAAGATSGGLMRSSIKPCVWLGNPGCYRNQDEVLWEESQRTTALRLATRAGKQLHRKARPSGHQTDDIRSYEASERRGGVTPFNVIPLPNADPYSSGGAGGHGAATPKLLCDWWVRYISPPGGVVCDPFMGSGTTGLSAIEHGRSYIGIEQNQGFFDLAARRIGECESPAGMLFGSLATSSL